MAGKLQERLTTGDKRLCVGEGYVFAFERRGYLRAGDFVPEVILEHPNLVDNLYREFVHAGSDTVLAFTYYAHREKMALIDREKDVEAINKAALQLARQVADDTGTMMAGNICNTNIWYPNPDLATREKAELIFKEQIEWAVAGGADYIVAETIGQIEEMKLAFDCIKKYGSGLPAVTTFGPTIQDGPADGGGETWDVSCRTMEELGAAVVGINCHRGPQTMVPLMRKVRAACKGPIASLPVPYRTNANFPAMFTFKDEVTGKRAFPDQLDGYLCTRDMIVDFTKEMLELDVQYLGLCCGASAGALRAMSETMGRKPPASYYSPDMTKHCAYGTDSKLKAVDLYRHQLGQ